jgi:hypothetical protein
MQRSAVTAGPGTALRPAFHNCTARRSTPNAAAHSPVLATPAASHAAAKSSGVMANQPDLAAQTMRPFGGSDQGAVDEGAMGILDRITRETLGKIVGCHIGNAFLPCFPTKAAVHFDANLGHFLHSACDQTMRTLFAVCQPGILA